MRTTSLSELHPLLRALVCKLGDPKYSVRDCTGERLVWHRAGCPIWATDEEAALVCPRHEHVDKDGNIWFSEGGPDSLEDPCMCVKH